MVLTKVRRTQVTGVESFLTFAVKGVVHSYPMTRLGLRFLVVRTQQRLAWPVAEKVREIESLVRHMRGFLS